MEQNRSSKYSFSLSNLLKLSIFEPIYAKTNCAGDEKPSSPRKESLQAACPSTPAPSTPPPCPGPPKCPPPKTPPCPSDKGGAGDAPPRRCDCQVPAGAKCSAGDRGKTGAGVTGSRTVRDCGPAKKSEELPEGAKYPGLLRHIHNAARYRLPQCFEGACVSLKQSAQNNWILGHSISFSSVSPGGYKLLMSYIDKSKPTSLPYFVMQAAPGGQISCEFRVGPTQGTRATMVAQIADAEIYSLESIFDAYFHNFTTSIIAVNKEFIAMHYLQALSEEISLGAEVVARVQEAEVSSVSGAGRWTTENQSVSATLGNRGLDLCYAKVITPYLTTAAMLEIGFAVRRAVATLAYEWHTDEWTVRGSADSDGLVGCTLQRALGGKHASVTCAISALLNHPNEKFRLGFGVTAAII